MAQDKIKALYDTFVKEGYEMESEAQFRKNLADPAKRKAAYDALVKDGYDMEAYDAFETNIGFGKKAEPTQPTAQSAPKQTTPAPTNKASEQTTATQQPPTPAPAPAPVDKAPEQPKWQPTEQDKIRMAYNLNSMMSDFNARSRARVEQGRRMIERYTPEGRRKLKAAKYQAQLAGTPTQVMGLTPDVSPSPSGNGETGTDGQAKPLLSEHGPVPYGVVEVDGQRKTQWLLPDGSLTTDFSEADKAEYGARRVRLINQFVGRMKANGLDPANQEDVQQQAQLDMISSITSPLRREGITESLWKEAEAQHKADKDRNASRHWGDYAAMGGGREMRIVTTAANRHDDLVSHMTRFDLQTMMDKAWSRVGDQLTENCYNQLRRTNPETPETELRTAASEWARQLSDMEIYNYAVEQNTPKSTLEFFGRKVADANLVNSITKGLARMSAGTPGDLAAYQQAMEEYGKDHKGASISGTVFGMAIDPTTWISGGMGSLAGKGAVNLGGRFLARRAAGMSAQVGERLFSSSLTGRILTGMAAGGANLGTFEAIKEGERQFMYGGYVNPETGEVEGYSLGAVLNSGVHGIGMGAATGLASPLIGNVADKAVKATTSTAGKVAMRGTEQLLSTVAEGTIFSIPEWISGDQDAFDVWTDNMAMMAGFKLSHAIKTAPAMIRSLRPVKPTGDRPLSRDERIHNNKSFAERLRERLDQSPSDIAMSKEEREELRSKGYGELSDLFAKTERDEERTGYGEKPEDGAIDFPTVEAEEIRESSEFDGYDAMARLMEDRSVSEATRAKAYYILTGRMLPMSTVTGWNREQDDDGSIIITSLSNQGGIVTSRKFSGEKEAQGEIDRIQRQSELNTIDIGEQYRNAEAQERVMSAAIQEISPGADPQTVYNIYEAAKRGDKNVSEEQHHLADMIDEAIERNSSAGDEVRPEAIRERISKETGIDIDKAIRKEPGKRTEQEQAAVDRYARELFPEPEQYEPTAEEAEADRVYEESRQLYLRYEQGEPEAQGEIDAIALRMNEAYQLTEDAFGAESEYYMAQMREEPWTLLNDPDLTEDQREAVLYYINADAALKGVMDASNEASQDKRDKVSKEIQHRTHTERGVIVPATMKADGRATYIVKGDVAMHPDGSGVDVRNSSEHIIILDEQGEYQFSSPDQILTVGETIDPSVELQTAYDTIDREQESIFSGVDMPYEQGTADHGEPTAEEAPADGNNGDENIPTEGNNGEENIPAVNVEEYDRGYSDAIEEAQNLTDERLSHYIDTLREGAQKQMQERGRVDDYIRGRLEALEFAQQERANVVEPSVPKTEENVLNNTENVATEGEIVSETVPSAETGEETALSRIPTNEEGEPIFESAPDPVTAWDGLVEAAGDDAGASEIAQAQIAQATSDLEKLKKKPPTLQTPKLKGTPMAMAKQRREAKEAYDKAMEDYNQQVADTQGRLDAWHRILAVQTSRNAEQRRLEEEARRERDAQLHDAAVAEFEEQQRIKAEKQAEQDAIGAHAVNPKIREKWETAPKAEGHEDALTLPDGSTINGRYILTEAGAASASHDINNAFAPTEGFPIDKNGQSVNDRDYAGDKDAQRIVEQMAGEYDNRALQDPVIVSKDGVVLSGNNRTMSGDLAAKQGTDTAYNEYLRKFGRKYGFTPEQVAGFKNPRVVFVPDEELPYDATTFARFNAQEKKSQSKPEAAVKLGKVVPDNVFTNIVNEISSYDRLSGFYADEKAVAQTLGALMSAGVINDKQMPELRTGTTLSAAGKELIENTLIGKTFQSAPNAVRQVIAVPILRESVVMGLSEIANNRTLAGKKYDLSKELADAIDLVYNAKTAQPDVYTEGVPVSPFGRIRGLFEDTRVTDATTLLLADILNSGKPSDLRKILASYNSEAASAAGGEYYFTDDGDIMPPRTKEEVLTLINKHFKNATPKEQQALVEAAIAERKQRADTEAGQRGGSAASEQTENALQRDGEREEPTADATAGITAEEDSDLTPEEQALAKRVQVTDNEWEEGDFEHPTYKREILIDGKHSVTQVDAPDEKGNYNGSYFEYAGRRADHIGKVAAYIDKMEVNTNPTEAQKEAGNYKKGHLSLQGMNISIENPRWSIRRGVDADGKPWASRMTMAYGYIRGTQGKDKDHIDIFLTEIATWDDYLEEMGFTKVYVIDQYNKDGSFDEHKVVYGLGDENQAKASFLENYSADWAEGRRIDVTEVTMEDFKKWAFDGKRKIKPFAEYKAVQEIKAKETEPATTSKGESAEGYNIEPATYKNKKGKETPMHRLTFGRELSAEEENALETFAKETLGESKGKFSKKRGWKDRDNGGWLFRTEEDARKAAEMVGDPDAVADAQPLSKEDIKEATSEPKKKKPTSPKKKGKPGNIATIEDLAEGDAPASEQKPTPEYKEGDLVELITGDKFLIRHIRPDGTLHGRYVESRLHGNDISGMKPEKIKRVIKSETPAPEEKPADEPKGQFKVTDEMREIEDELRRLLGVEDDEGDRGIYFRDDELTPEERKKRDRRIFTLGVDYACYFIDNGIVAFPDFAKAIVGRLGQRAKPFIKAWYDGLRRMPDYTDMDFTPFEDVSRFDIENFDKPDYDALRDAEMRLAERKAQEASQEAEKALIEQRNEQRKEDDKQRESDTAALADKGAAVASEAESLAETSEDAGELAGASEKIDKALEEVNEQLALLGYYEGEANPKDYNEAYGYMRNAEKKALKDAVDLAKQLVSDLGIEIDKVAGSATAKKSKTPTAVRANIAPAGGDISIHLPLKEGRELMISISLDPSQERGDVTYSGDNLQVTSIMYRVENPNASGYDRYGRNCWANADVTYKELLSGVERETYKYLPERTSTDGEYKSGDSVEYSSNGGREWTASKVVEVNADGTLKLDTGMAPIIYVNATLDQVRRKGAAPAEKPAISGAEAPAQKQIKETPEEKPAKPAMREVDVEGLMGALNDASRQAREDGQEHEVKLSDHYKPTEEDAPKEKPSPADKPADALSVEQRIEQLIDRALADEWIQKSFQADNDINVMENAIYDKMMDLLYEDMDNLDHELIKAIGNDLGKIAFRAAQEYKEGLRGTPKDKPTDATAAVVDLLKGGKPKKEKKSVSSQKKPKVKPEETVGDLFSGLFDEPETPNKNEKGTTSAGSRELADAERPDTMGKDETGTDGGKKAGGTGGNVKVRDTPAKSDGVGKGTDGTPHGDDEERGVQQSAGNRGRDERGTDSGVGSGGMERGGTAGQGPISERSTDESTKGLSEGEPTSSTGEGGRPTAVSNKPQKPSKRYTNNFRYDEDGNAADTYTPAQRLEGNVAAVETLADVLFGDGKPTEEQKLIMSRFRGWGQVDLGRFYSIEQMANPSYNTSKPLRRLAEAIKRLDPKNEKKLFEAIKRASLSAYYTPTLVARAMNSFLGLAGFRGGQLLDPSMGNGIFEGTLRQKIQERTAITGVELDWLSGQLSRLLYPDANILIGGFEKSGLTPGSFDVVTSNVPFGQFGVNDPSWKSDSSPIKRSAQNRIHNYYAVKMLELTRPGGLVSMMTSTAVMDTPSNQNIRAHIAEQGEIIGAIRLPDNTFQGTGATADIIFIRKWRDAEDRKQTREEGDYVERVEKPFLSLHETTAPNKVTGKPSKVRYNGYYAENPKLMIGEVRAGNQYSQEGFGLTSDLDTYAIATEVELRVGGLVGKRKGSLFNPTRTTREVQQAVREAYKGDGNWESNGNLVVQDGKVGILNAKSNEYGEVSRVFEGTLKHNKMLPRVKAMIEVRTAMKKLIAAQIDGEKDSTFKRLRNELQSAYDNFTRTYGKLQDAANSFILDDIDGYTIQALETWKSGKFVGLSDIFTKNTIKPALRIDGVKTPQESITTSLAEYGYVRPDFMEKILGEDWADKCGDFIFKIPNSEDEYVTKDEYLSGDVVSKLAEAREAARKDNTYDRNVKALEEVQPERIPYDDIAIHLGARWISDDILNDFMKEMFGLHATARGRHYDPELGRMVEDFKSGVRYLPDVDSFEINVDKKELGGQAQEWETPKKSAKEIFQAALEDKTIIIKWKDEDGVEHPDEEQTELANQKVADLRERFEQWLPSDPARVEKLEQDYNDRFNRIVKRKFDGSHLIIPGLMGKELHPHQKDAVWMLINNQGGIVDHIVGAGKTLVMQSAIMEMRRMGIAKKPMIVALKSTVSQIAREFKEAFPSARVLAPNDKDFQKENRKKFIANISLNDYDCVILSHEQYCMLPHTEESERAVIDEQLWQLDNMIEYLYGQSQDQLTKRQLKALEKRRENLIARLEKRLDRSVDREFCFENLGVDYLFVDECHQFKSLPYVTSYDKIAGLGDAKGSDRAVALLTGIRYLQKMHQGDKGTIFLSGTTITNSLVEIYNLLNYLRPRELQRLGMPTFDAWASTFAVHTSELEAGTTGDFKMKDRFRSFDNVPELSQLYAEIADVRNDTNLKLPKPAVDGRTVIVPQSEAMAEINREIVNMLNNKNGSYFGIFPKNPDRAPWGLHAATLSAKAAVSPRLIFPDIEDDGGKVAAVCSNVKKCYDEMSEQKGVQLIFCEIGVPEKGKKYDAYTDMITRLTKDYGIPRSEIAYIQEAPTEEKRKALFQKVRDGKVRILIGGTKNMGTGVNVQDRITDMHMLTVPWTPSALEQCIGRGARQGNLVARDFMNDKVRVHYYATEGSLDLYKYQLLDAKGKMFTQFKMGTVNGGRSFDEGSADEDGNIDPAEMVAILSGNPVIFEKAKQEKAVKKLRALRNGFERDYQRKRAKYNELTARKQNLERFIRLNTADRKAIEKEGFVPDDKGVYPTTVTVRAGSAYYGENKTFDKPKEAGEYIHQLLDAKKTVWLTGFGKTAKVEEVSEDVRGLFSTHTEVRIGDGDRDILYRVRLSDDPVNAGQAFRSILKKIVDNGDTYARELEEVNSQLNGLNLGDGVFPKQKELDAAVAKLRELTTEYNKLGKPKDTNDQSDKTKFRLVEDKETLDFLENQLQKKGYRYAQWANHGVLPPMTAKVNGEWRPPMLFGRYEQSEEGMRKANGKADLVQGNGRTTGDVAYNPYFHIRTNPLNDQFSAAYDRPELIVVEGYYPESEETSGYKADGAKNSVGLMAWHSGSVNGQLSQDTKVNTMLSRYFKPSRIVPWSEVADLIMENIGEQDITFPLNVVPPMLRAELAKRGARFEGISGNVTESDIPKLKEIEEQIKKGNYEAGLERAKEYANAYQSSPDAMSARVSEIAEKLHTPVRIVSTSEEAKTLPSARRQKSKGFFDPDTNEIVVVLPNNINVADVENTVVHEVVGHKGLRAMIGEEKFDSFLDEVYDHLSAPLRKIVEAMERKLYDKEVDKIFRKKQSAHSNTGEANENYYNDMAEAHLEAGRKREGFKREATEEYMADLGGRIGDKGFEKMSREELTLWGKIKAKVQQFLDKFLRGLKIAKSIRLSDKDLSYILFKSWKRQRDGHPETNVFAKAEDTAMRHKSGYDADEMARFRDPDMGLEETITKMKAEAMQANADNLQAKRDAMRAIGGNLNHLRSAMARQREYDITTVKSVTDLAKILMEAGLLDTPSNGEVKRLLGAVNAVVGRQDTSAMVRRVFDVMLHNYLGRERKTFDTLLTIKGSKVDARGVEVQGMLDPKGQMLGKAVRRLINMKLRVDNQRDDFDELIARAEGDLGDESAIKRENAEIELEALYIARQYATDIAASKDEEAELRQCMKDAETDHKEGRMSDDAYRQYMATANEDIRANLIARAEAYESLIERLGERLNESIEEAKAWREEAKERVNQIHHYANSDLKDIPYRTEKMTPTFGSKFSNFPLVRLFMAPTATMEQVCRLIGSKSVDGNGYIKRMVVDRWQECRDKEWIGTQEAEAKMDAKANEIAGVKHWSDLYSISRKKAGTLSWRDGNEQVEHDVTQGNLMYVYMADKMSDGRRLLRHMGITDDDVENATSTLDPRLREIADWVQDDFLPELRERYNETHKRMYGAPMAKIDNYVHLRVNKSTIEDKTDIAENTTYDGNMLPKTITGSIIKRTRHNHPIDIIGTDGVSLILDHVRENETWNAMSEYRRDLTTLLRYDRFRNRLRHMKTIYGSGDKFDKLFFDLSMLVGGAYKPKVEETDRNLVNLTKLATGACIALRINTALKQLLSYHAFGGEAASTRLISNMARPRHCLNFCLDNLPAMQRRWRERLAGNEVLRDWNGDWDWTRAEWVKKLQRIGITPNSFVDLLTCCMGAEAAYQSNLKELKDAGFDKDTAHRKAVIHAEQVFNLSQQSSELPYLSLLQNNRSYITTCLVNFRNSPFSYLRQSIQSKRELINMAKNKTAMIEFETKKGVREGLTPDQAEAYANKKYNRNWARNIIKSLDFDFILPALWCLGITGMWYLVFGKDNDKKKELLVESAKRGVWGPLEGLTFGGTIPDAVYSLLSGDKYKLEEETSPAMGHIKDLWNSAVNGDNIGAANHFVNFATAVGVGINPQTLEDVAAAGMDYFGNDQKTLRDFEMFAMRVISVPQSQVDMVYFDEVALTARQAANMTADELAERYASYKLLHNEFATVWFYNDETRKEREARHRKKAQKLIKEELDKHVSTDSVRSLIAESDEITKTEGELAKLKKARKYSEYREGMSRLRQEHDMQIHARVKRYKHDIDLLTKQFLAPGISREESDSIVGKMIQKRENLMNDINNRKK